MFDVNTIVATGGLTLIALIIFGEVGLMLGFFLPGDTLLIAAGILAATGKMDLAALLPVVTIAAIAGDHTGYWIGHHLGPRIFRKPDGIIFQKAHIERSEKFFAKHGSKTLLISHFLPVIRTFTPLLAGAGKMTYKSFTLFNAAGDIAWAISVTLLGYFVGSKIPNIDHYIMLVIGSVVVIAIASPIVHLIQRKIKALKKSDT